MAEIERVKAALRSAFRDAGHGSISRVERAMKLKAGYFRKRLVRNRLDLGVLIAVLKELKIHPANFFLDALVDDDPFGPNGGATASPRRSRKEGKRGGGAALPADDNSADLGAQAELTTWLETMDGLRYEDPISALEQLRSRVTEIPQKMVSRLLAICGSTHRCLGSQRNAHRCLDAAEKLAEDDLQRADVFRRRSLVICDGGEYGLALKECRKATRIFSDSKVAPEEGKSLVLEAKFLIYLRRFQEADRILERAFLIVPVFENQHRVSILQYRGFIHGEKGEIGLALRFIRAAKELKPKTSDLAHLLWSEARLLMTVGQVELALNLLERAGELLKSLSPLDALLVAAERIRILIKADRVSEAREAGRSVVDFVGLLQGNAAAEATVTSIYRHCTAETLRAAAITGVIKELRQFRANRRKIVPDKSLPAPELRLAGFGKPANQNESI